MRPATISPREAPGSQATTSTASGETIAAPRSLSNTKVYDVAVIGGGFAGLAAALTLSNAGFSTCVIERDPEPHLDNAESAFETRRSGAPQARHSHAFLARLRNLLSDSMPELLDALYAAGATDMDPLEGLPQGLEIERTSEDDQAIGLAIRRTTFEWVLRRHVRALPGVELRYETAVEQLLHGSRATATGPAATQRATAPDERDRERLEGDRRRGLAPTTAIVGVRTDDGEEIRARLTVVANGRRSDINAMIGDGSPAIEEESEDTGIIYFTRWFRSLPGSDHVATLGAGDLGYLKIGVFPGDSGTFSITLACAVRDQELRAYLGDPDNFLRVAAHLVPTRAHIDPAKAAVETDVFTMAGLLNRTRSFVVDGQPRLTGLVAVGDAHTCSNPLYGRGCTLAFVQAEALTKAALEHQLESEDLVLAYESATARLVRPWYEAAVRQDSAGRAYSQWLQSGGDPKDSEHSAKSEPSERGERSDSPPPEAAFVDIIRRGVLPAARTSPAVFRAIVRSFHLLTEPESLMSDPEVLVAVMEAYRQREDRPEPEPLGPTRSALLAALSRPRPQG